MYIFLYMCKFMKINKKKFGRKMSKNKVNENQ